MDGTYPEISGERPGPDGPGGGAQGGQRPLFLHPKGANIFGWAGVDGIHFCFVRGFGTQIFAVSPANAPGNSYTRLRRILRIFSGCCWPAGDSAALEQAWMWDEGTFDTFLSGKTRLRREQRSVLEQLSETLDLTPMEQPGHTSGTSGNGSMRGNSIFGRI